MISPIRTQHSYESARLSLRPIRKSDSGLIGLYAGDIRVSGPTRSIPHPLPPGAIDAFIEQSQNPARVEDVWVLDGGKSDLAEVVGVIGLKRLDRRQGELGYWLAPAFWGIGLAREAVQTLIRSQSAGEQNPICGSLSRQRPLSAGAERCGVFLSWRCGIFLRGPQDHCCHLDLFEVDGVNYGGRRKTS
jgi:hypothetical protein